MKIYQRDSRLAAKPLVPSLGFTLIEILIVMFILATIIGLAVVQLTPNDRDDVRDEADRLVVALQAARDEAILQGSLLSLEMGSDGYRFLRPGDKGKFVAIEDVPFNKWRLPQKMVVVLEMEGQAVSGSQNIMLDPSGMLPAFNIAFVLNDARWWVVAQTDGRIRSTPTKEAPPT